MGFDIPGRTDYVEGAALNAVGLGLTIILFTLDETAYGRELAARRDHCGWDGGSSNPARGDRTCGFYNTAGFNAVPFPRGMMWRGVRTVPIWRNWLREAEAFEVARDLTYNLTIPLRHMTSLPRLTRSTSPPAAGMVHLGPGAFFRAFIAPYTDEARGSANRRTGASLPLLRAQPHGRHCPARLCLYRA